MRSIRSESASIKRLGVLSVSFNARANTSGYERRTVKKGEETPRTRGWRDASISGNKFSRRAHVPFRTPERKFNRRIAPAQHCARSRTRSIGLIYYREFLPSQKFRIRAIGRDPCIAGSTSSFVKSCSPRCDKRQTKDDGTAVVNSVSHFDRN